MVDGGHLLVKALKREGVDRIFTLSGLQIQAIYNACIDEGIRIIDTRHEQAAVQMADGWSRVTGRPGVAVLTAGPGMTNGITGIANAFEAASPVIILAGRSPLAQFEAGSFQEMDQVALVRTITKWAATVYESRRIPEFLSMAFRHALSGRPGPAYLDIPEDIIRGEIDEEQVWFPTGHRTTARPQGEPELVNKALELLLSAKRPLVVAGGGVWWSQAGAELKGLIETAKLPLVTVGMGRGCVPEDHPLCFGPIRVGLRHADVVMVVGTRLNYRLAYGRPPLFSDGVRIIQIDIEGREIGRNRSVEIGIVGDARAVLGQMVGQARERCQGREEGAWIEECRGYAQNQRERLEADLSSDQVPIHPLRLCREIGDFLSRDATLVLDGGDTTVFGTAVLKAYHPGHWLDGGPMWCLGVGIPFGIAAKLARPDKQVLILSGDGSFGFNVMEYNTAVRHQTPIVTVINNDGAWGMIKHDQEAAFGAERVIATELGVTRYDKVVEALGGYGEYVERPGEIRPALERAFSSGLPACVNVRVDPTASSSGIFGGL